MLLDALCCLTCPLWYETYTVPCDRPQRRGRRAVTTQQMMAPQLLLQKLLQRQLSSQQNHIPLQTLGPTPRTSHLKTLSVSHLYRCAVCCWLSACYALIPPPALCPACAALVPASETHKKTQQDIHAPAQLCPVLPALCHVICLRSREARLQVAWLPAAVEGALWHEHTQCGAHDLAEAA